MMPPYPLRCYGPGCDQLAIYKIASRWSDGLTHELKTYTLSCADCLAEHFRVTCAKQGCCRRAPGETLESPGVFELSHGRRDLTLKRCDDLERLLIGAIDQSPPSH